MLIAITFMRGNKKILYVTAFMKTINGYGYLKI